MASPIKHQEFNKLFRYGNRLLDGPLKVKADLTIHLIAILHLASVHRIWVSRRMAQC